MRSHRSVRLNLFEYLRGELSDQDRRGVEAHLRSCDQCSAELNSMRKTSKLLDQSGQRPSERRNDLYWQHFSAKVERRIDEQSRAASAPSFVERLLDSFTEYRKPFGIGFASALTLMLIAFGIWSLWLRGPSNVRLDAEAYPGESTRPPSVSIQKASLDARTQDYLEQSKVLLIGLLNTDSKSLDGSRPLLQREREVSRKLVHESQVLAAALNDPSDRRLRELVSDLQLILVQIANLSAEQSLPGVEIVKSGIEHNDILFKINLEEIHRLTQSSKSNNVQSPVKPTT